MSYSVDDVVIQTLKRVIGLVLSFLVYPSAAFTNFWKTILADHTVARRMISYWHHTVVCLSVCLSFFLSVTLCIAVLRVGSAYFLGPPCISAVEIIRLLR